LTTNLGIDAVGSAIATVAGPPADVISGISNAAITFATAVASSSAGITERVLFGIKGLLACAKAGIAVALLAESTKCDTTSGVPLCIAASTIGLISTGLDTALAALAHLEAEGILHSTPPTAMVGGFR